IKVSFLMNQPAVHERAIIVQYIIEWFDLNRNLQDYYQMAEHDPILCSLTKKYSGLRLIGIPDLFEALGWAIIGQ
ncbi:8-oxoguanine DNA glycosylase, N-terminal domain-containing protein, partial [Lysinibacillus fusiformis]|uniref:8-oxoguanine DNA glycosylase, N-terminal domain-containing protein n=1 Tax=Lysinibacillus fusiformis TaxID=28031 RepID=UPI0020BE2EF5